MKVEGENEGECTAGGRTGKRGGNEGRRRVEWEREREKTVYDPGAR
jgi:hypothetical protein